ncbi:MAG TPA: hypothetical protein DCW55_03710 [Candidatus Pacebacteria bacterium]|nr:MAG: hypothetical protein A2378_01135 [Candidatus Pacebacteria bacterium RIFOXYB1_FULL_44_10]HAU99314.1 hypothetical protein [Candidatus Paceibacterota bacterium]HAX01525.1 hypothetical protein [Candidatus Paceibacterota bacterium]
MFYENMPLYLLLIEILKIEYTYIHNVQKEYKYSLGDEVICLTWNIIDLFIEAQTTNANTGEKKKIVTTIAQKLECLKLRIRFLTELKQLSLHQTTHINELVVGIGKMIGSWQKNV